MLRKNFEQLKEALPPPGHYDEKCLDDDKIPSFMVPYPVRICQKFESFEEIFFHKFFFNQKLGEKWKFQTHLATSWMIMKVIDLNREKNGGHDELIRSNLSSPHFLREDPVISFRGGFAGLWHNHFFKENFRGGFARLWQNHFFFFQRKLSRDFAGLWQIYFSQCKIKKIAGVSRV